VPLRILFAASPAIAVPSLEAVADLCGRDRRFELAGILTNPDSPRGRSGRPEPTECAAAAERLGLGIPVLKPERLGAEARVPVGGLRPDLLVSFAYGKIFGPKFLALFPAGGINVHPSLLPRHRGPTPIPAAILNGDGETGITVQRLVAEMDAGDILAVESFPLYGNETTASLTATMAARAAGILPGLLGKIASGTAEGRPQDHGAASYCGLISKADGIIDWNMGAREIGARIRAYNPRPLCETAHGDQRLFILRAEAVGDSGGRAEPRGNQFWREADHGGTFLPIPAGRYGAEPRLGGGGKAAGFADRGARPPHEKLVSVAEPGLVLGKDANKGILIGTGDGVLAAGELQYGGRKALEWRDFLNGARNFIGERLGGQGR